MYLEVRRNLRHPFLEVFDVPKPATTRGQRDVTNVPAQSLTLMNSPFAIEQARKWADRIVKDGNADPRRRIEQMFLEALGRAPSSGDLDEAQTFVAGLAAEHDVATDRIMSDLQVWQDFGQALFNLKEFIYIR